MQKINAGAVGAVAFCLLAASAYGDEIGAKTSEVFGYDPSNVFSGQVGALQYGCSLEDNGLGLGIGDFNLGDIFKSITLGPFSCEFGVDLDKAACKPEIFDRGKTKVIDFMNTKKKKAGGEVSRRSREWIDRNILGKGDDRRSVWGYGKKAQEAAKNYCSNASGKIWGNKNQGDTGENSSVIDSKKRAQIINQNAEKALVATYRASSPNIQKWVRRQSVESKEEILRAAGMSDPANTNAQVTDAVMQKFPSVVADRMKEELALSNPENYAKSETQTIAMVQAGLGTSYQNSVEQNSFAQEELSIQQKVNSKCSQNDVASQVSCVTAAKTKLRQESSSTGTRNKIYTSRMENYDNAMEAVYNTKIGAEAIDNNEGSNFGCNNGSFSSDDDIAKCLNAADKASNARANKMINANMLYDLGKDLQELEVRLNEVSASSFDKAAAIKETDLIAKKASEQAKNITEKIIGKVQSILSEL